MSNICNSINIKTLKISQLKEYDTINSDDIFLVIEKGDESFFSRRTTFNNIVNSLKYIDASYKGKFTGSFTGSSIGQFTGSFSGSSVGNFSGNFNGNVTTNNLKATGSFKYSSNPLLTGSFFGINYISNFKNTGVDVSFNGTASYSVSSSFAKYALAATSLTAATGGGVGSVNQYAYWISDSSLGSSNYLVRLPNSKNKFFPSFESELNPLPSYFQIGRTGLNNPLHFTDGNEYLLGENLIFQSSSNQSVYCMGMQENTLYLRTDANFVMYHSGTFDLNDKSIGAADEKDRKLNPGTNGYTSFVSTRRLIGIGDFNDTKKVNAQCHVHIDKVTGYRSGYNPVTNAFLITSGSSFDPLLKLSGVGNLDVSGDVTVLSTFVSSDERLKNNIKPISNSFELINKLNPVEFIWNANNRSDYGLIAQEVENNFPELVKEDMNGYKTIKYNSFIPLLVDSIKSLKTEIEQLKQKINKLENNL